MIKKSIFFLFETSLLIIVPLTIILSIAFIFLTISNDIFPGLLKYADNINSLTQKNFCSLVLYFLILYTVIIYFHLKDKLNIFILFHKFKNKEKVILVFASYFLSALIIENIFKKTHYSILLLVLMTLILFIFFIYFVHFITNYNLKYFRTIYSNLINLRINFKKKKEDRILFLLKIIVYLFSIGILMILLIVGYVLTLTEINSYLIKQKQIQGKFVITNIVPKVTIIGETVILDGYNFGFKENEFFQLKTSKGSVSGIKDWNNNKVEFVVPLDLPEGKNELWLERTKTASSQSALLKTNKVDLTILSRWDFYPQQKDYQYPPSFLDYFRITVKKLKRIIFFNWGVIQLCGKLINC